jgi:hypothetical protein
MNILLWHVHGAWTTAFVQGGHTYLVPVTADRGPYGRGRARTYDWPDTVHEYTPAQLAGADVDVVVLQRPEEIDRGGRWLRRQIGRDVPAVYVEHNAPRGDVPDTRHPMADRDDLILVHVTGFNDLFWDSGATPTTVISTASQPAAAYTGELPRLGVATSEPLRRCGSPAPTCCPASPTGRAGRVRHRRGPAGRAVAAVAGSNVTRINERRCTRSWAAAGRIPPDPVDVARAQSP